ncbi:MAG: DUF3558 domain-containing protein [Sciscionella sp.]
MRTGTPGRSLGLLAVVAGAVLLAGCGSVSGQPTPSATSSAVPSTVANLHGAPHVANPLKIDKYVRNPCSVLSNQQLKELKSSISMATTGKARSTPGGRTCSYASLDDFSLAQGSIGFITTGGGLSAVYADRRNLGIFRQIPPIEGYPAAINDLTDQTKEGSCRISVGVTDQATVEIILDISDYGNKPANSTTPCVPAQKLAQVAIRSMKGGS